MTEHKGRNARRVGGGLNAHWQLLDRTPKGRGDDRGGWPRTCSAVPAATILRSGCSATPYAASVSESCGP